MEEEKQNGSFSSKVKIPSFKKENGVKRHRKRFSHERVGAFFIRQAKARGGTRLILNFSRDGSLLGERVIPHKAI